MTVPRFARACLRWREEAHETSRAPVVYARDFTGAAWRASRDVSFRVVFRLRLSPSSFAFASVAAIGASRKTHGSQLIRERPSALALDLVGVLADALGGLTAAVVELQALLFHAALQGVHDGVQAVAARHEDVVRA